MKLWLIALLISLILPIGWGCMAHEPYPEIHSKHFFYGYPAGTPKTNDLIIRDGYALSSNDSTKLADWVAYRLTPDMLEESTQKTRDWQADPWLEDHETLEPEDYHYAHMVLGMDRGHLVPLKDLSATSEWMESNYLSNIIPQPSELNRVVWFELEHQIRKLTRKCQREVYIIAGPIYDNPTQQLPNADEPHTIPTGFWKVVGTKEPFQVWVFIFPIAKTYSTNPCDYQTTIDDTEKQTHLDLLWQINANELTKPECFIPYLGS